MKMTLKEAIGKQTAARARYAGAAREFRESFAELYALDRMLSDRGVGPHQGFGDIPNVMTLRHSVALPDESGSIGTDIMKIIETTAIEG